MRWDTIANIHQNPTVKSLSFWFVAIPIIVKLLEAKAVAYFVSNLQLPFSWMLFYFASLLFFASNVLYLVFCPKVIKQYRSWQEFDTREGSYEKLAPLISSVLPRLARAEAVGFLKHHVDEKHIGFVDDKGALLEPYQVNWEQRTLRGDIDALESSRLLKPALRDLYASIRERSQLTHNWVRLVILFLQGAGLAALAVVLCQNVYYVWHHYDHSWLALILNQ